MTIRQAPDWVSEKPKRFAWTLGLGMTFAMTIITNSGIRGMLPRTICANGVCEIPAPAAPATEYARN